MCASLLATVVTGGVGIVAMCIYRCRCLVHCTNCCHVASCKFGFLDNAIVDTHEVEFRNINANGNDLFYVSKQSVNVNADEDDDRHTNPPSESIPVNADIMRLLAKGYPMD